MSTDWISDWLSYDESLRCKCGALFPRLADARHGVARYVKCSGVPDESRCRDRVSHDPHMVILSTVVVSTRVCRQCGESLSLVD